MLNELAAVTNTSTVTGNRAPRLVPCGQSPVSCATHLKVDENAERGLTRSERRPDKSRLLPSLKDYFLLEVMPELSAADRCYDTFGRTSVTLWSAACSWLEYTYGTMFIMFTFISLQHFGHYLTDFTTKKKIEYDEYARSVLQGRSGHPEFKTVHFMSLIFPQNIKK